MCPQYLLVFEFVEFDAQDPFVDVLLCYGSLSVAFVIIVVVFCVHCSFDLYVCTFQAKCKSILRKIKAA